MKNNVKFVVILGVLAILIIPMVSSSIAISTITVDGTVKNGYGVPVFGVTVELRIYGSGKLLDIDGTDSNGHYSVSSVLFPGLQVLLVYSKSGYVTQTAITDETCTINKVVPRDYLGTDWARTLSSTVIVKAYDLISGYTSLYDKAEAIQTQTEAEWNHSAGHIGGKNYFDTDSTILASYEALNPPEYQYVCWSAAIIASAYCRAAGIPSRILFYETIDTEELSGKLEGNFHFTTEVLINNEWILLDVDDNYGWFDEEDGIDVDDWDTKTEIQKLWPNDNSDSTRIKTLWIVTKIIGDCNPYSESDFEKVMMSEEHPARFNWYKNTFWPNVVFN